MCGAGDIARWTGCKGERPMCGGRPNPGPTEMGKMWGDSKVDRTPLNTLTGVSWWEDGNNDGPLWWATTVGNRDLKWLLNTVR